MTPVDAILDFRKQFTKYYIKYLVMFAVSIVERCSRNFHQNIDYEYLLLSSKFPSLILQGRSQSTLDGTEQHMPEASSTCRQTTRDLPKRARDYRRSSEGNTSGHFRMSGI